MVANSSSVLEGSRISLTCSVASLAGPHSRISASWHLLDKQNRQREVIRQDRDGVTWAGQMYREQAGSGGLQMVRTGSDIFTLDIEGSQRQDAGSYECRVAEWVPAGDGEWQMLGERFAQTSVDVTSLGEWSFRLSSVLSGVQKHTMLLISGEYSMGYLIGWLWPLTCISIFHTSADSRGSIFSS